MSSPYLRALACSKCGAPLRVEPDQRIVNCSYCGTSHAFIPPPPAAPPDVSFQPGERVAVEWGGVWWPARVVKAAGPDRWLVNYADWDTAWDEEVDRSRIRHRSAADARTGSPMRTLLAIALGGLVLVGAAGVLVLVQHRAATAATVATAAPDYTVGATYQQGEAVKVYWKSTWYDGHILSVEGNGKYEISYDGWSSSWDETVTGRRLKKKPGESTATRAADTPKGSYHQGQAVLIEWKRRWWPGRIKAVAGTDRYLIHYDGYSASWDETVGPSRLKPR